MSSQPPDSNHLNAPGVQIGVDTRAAFLTRTYVHLFGAIIGFVLIEVALFSSGMAETIARSMLSINWLFILGGFMVVSWIASRAAFSAKSVAAQYAALGAFVVAEALIFVPMLYIANALLGEERSFVMRHTHYGPGFTEDEIRLAKLYNIRPPIRSVGCRRCAETGYRGRLPIQEVFLVNSAMADRIAGGGTYSEVYDVAVASGMRPLQQVGIERVRSGETTLEELERVLGLEAEEDRGERPTGGAESAEEEASAEDLIAAAAGELDAEPGPEPGVEPEPESFDRAIVVDEPRPQAGRPRQDAPILVVDDDPEDRLLLRTLLNKHGFEVEEVQDGGEALDRIGEGDRHSLVVLDLEMPTVDGREVLSRLRSSGSTMALPVVVLTSSPDPEDEYRLMEGGADDYLRKPLDPPRFIARIKAALRRARMM